jgi:hypothetical protein
MKNKEEIMTLAQDLKSQLKENFKDDEKVCEAIDMIEDNVFSDILEAIIKKS